MPETTLLGASITCWPSATGDGAETGLLAAASLAGLLRREIYQVKENGNAAFRPILSAR
jgi:hypothetical protein